MNAVLLADSGGAVGALFGVVFFVVGLGFFALMLFSAWKVSEKMGDPGWMGIVPFLNYYRIFQRTKPGQAILWTIGSYFCCIGAVIGMIDLSKLFNKEVGFALGLIFLPFIFYPLLAFGNATYVGPPPPRLG